MEKTKLTLYVDKKTRLLAHKTARLSGKSISTLVKEYFIRKGKEIRSPKMAHSVSQWVGLLNTKKGYRAMRDEDIKARLRRYEGLD